MDSKAIIKRLDGLKEVIKSGVWSTPDPCTGKIVTFDGKEWVLLRLIAGRYYEACRSADPSPAPVFVIELPEGVEVP